MNNAHAEQPEVSGEIKLVVLDPEKNTSNKNAPLLDGNAISQALRIADRIQDVSYKFWVFNRKKIIQSALKETTQQNVYSFVKYMITTTNTQSVLGDIKNFVSFECLKHLLLCLLKQAEDCGLNDTFQYKKLRKEYNIIVRTGGSAMQRTVKSKLLKETNIYIENLYLEMSKVLV